MSIILRKEKYMPCLVQHLQQRMSMNRIFFLFNLVYFHGIILSARGLANLSQNAKIDQSGYYPPATINPEIEE